MVSSTKARRYLGLLLAVLLPGEPATVDAGVIINGTRHIYPERQAEITIQLTNEDGAAPRLVQAWVEPADRRTGPEDSHVPFSLSPPVFRIEAGKGHAMRLVYSREPLPEDRETLFWLNVLEVPPRFHPLPTLGDEQANQLRFAFRIRTKVFFRPDRLPGSLMAHPGSCAGRSTRRRRDGGWRCITRQPFMSRSMRLRWPWGHGPMPACCAATPAWLRRATPCAWRCTKPPCTSRPMPRCISSTSTTMARSHRRSVLR